MASNQKNNSDLSSIKTEFSSPGFFDLSTSSTDEILGISLKNSASSSTIKSSPRNSEKYDEFSEFSSDIMENRSTNLTDRQNITSTSSNGSSVFVTETSTSLTEVRSGTTATITDNEYESAKKTDVTSYSDNSDSAFTNSHSNFTQTIDSNISCGSDTQRSVRENTDEVNRINDNRDDVQSISKSEERRQSLKSQNLNESSTQTPNTANLNVISNIQLSESTLNIIFNHVLQDVNNKQANSLKMSSLTATLQEENKENKQENQPPSDSTDAKIINVQPISSFYLNRKEDIVVSTEHSRVIKYMISNVGTGSPYSKPAEVPQVVVPRYSALPRTSSMEVNTSSVDSTDKESDTVSLVDSLEDGISPRRGEHDLLGKDENQALKSDDLAALFPDNSEASKIVKSPKRAAVFFVPIENRQKEELKQPVSYHLPAKVKEKLSRRQLKREQKIQQSKSNFTSPRSDSNYISASDTGNQISFTVNNNPEYVDVKSVPLLPEINNQKARRKSRAALPSIQNIRKIKIDSKDNIKYTECEKIRDRNSKPIKRRSITKYEKITSKNESFKQNPSRNFHKFPEKLSPIYMSRNEYTCDAMPKEIYHKTQFGNSNKRIEILEIMECVGNKHHTCPKVGKSKIPVLVQNKLPKIEKKTLPKPVYLEFDEAQDFDPKMDQLIANILIETLNKYDTSSAPSSGESKRNVLKLGNEKRPDDIHVINNNKYQRKFDVIPEESSRQSSLDDSSSKSEKTPSTGRLIETAADILTRNVLKNNNVQEKLYKSNKSSKNSSKSNSKSEEFNQSNPPICGGRIEDVLTIPQGWITFYMLHKNQGSPDSTSDEGTKLLREKQNIPEDGKNLKRNNSINDCSKDNNTKSDRIFNEDSEDFTTIKKDKSRRDTLDTIVSSDAFSDNLNPALPHANTNEQSSKQHSSSKNANDTNGSNSNNTKFANSNQYHNQGWSVTVSGMNAYGQLAPDVEMRLKFPISKDNSDFCSQTKDDEEIEDSTTSYCHPSTERSCQLVRRHNHQNLMNSVVSVTPVDNHFSNGRFPIINQGRRVSQQIDSNLTNTVVPFGHEPRQTKTSSRRYAMNRHVRDLQTTDANVTAENILNLSTETGILRKFSEMTVNGNGIHPERRSSLVYGATPR
ncbi:hypothetical protein Trydic_g3847 [Trypoxylus dichotomus]